MKTSSVYLWLKFNQVVSLLKFTRTAKIGRGREINNLATTSSSHNNNNNRQKFTQTHNRKFNNYAISITPPTKIN